MKTINGGEEYEHGGEPDNFQVLANRLIAHAEAVLRLRATAPFAGRLALPPKLPIPPDSISLN